MIPVQEDLTQDPEYQQKINEWNQQLRKSITDKRKVLLQHLKSTFQIDASQASLRTLSWTHSKLMLDQDYNQEANQVMKGFVMPGLFGANKQEAYHQTHFINACVLSLLRPHTPTFSEEQTVSVSCKFDPNLTTSDRLEEMERLYHHLLELTPKQDQLEPKQVKITLTHIYSILTKVLTLLENLHEVYDIQKRSPEAGRGGATPADKES